MFEVVAKYLAAGRIKFENGFVIFADQRMLFLPDNVLFDVQKSLQNKFGEQQGSSLTYQIFRDGGKNISNAIREKINLKGAEIVKWIATIASSAGWGKISMVDFNDTTKQSLFSIDKSPFPTFISTTKPVCHITRGLIAGTLSTVFKVEIEGVEIECIAEGKKKCIMVFQPRNEWMQAKSSNIRIPAQYQLPELVK